MHTTYYDGYLCYTVLIIMLCCIIIRLMLPVTTTVYVGGVALCVVRGLI